jgi:hypothetical protein
VDGKVDVTAGADSKNWFPVRFFIKDGTPRVDWFYLGADRFVHSFFDDTVAQRRTYPFSAFFRRELPIEFLGDLYQDDPGIYPTGFIFHMSRCGSTLVSQMLAALPQNIVISEAPPIDSILRCGAANESRTLWLKWMISALARKRFPEEKHFFVKFDSWNTAELRLVRETFPGVPWIFLYRDPVEVIVSQLRRPGSQMVPGALAQIFPDLGLDASLAMTPEEYCSRVLAKFCEKAAGNLNESENGIAVSYNSLPGGLTEKIAEHFELNFSEDDLNKIDAATKNNAKSPTEMFMPDGEEKRAAASPAVIEAAARYAGPWYEILQGLQK